MDNALCVNTVELYVLIIHIFVFFSWLESAASNTKRCMEGKFQHWPLTKC